MHNVLGSFGKRHASSLRQDLPAGALHFGPRDEMIKLGKERVEFLKSRGYDKAELYGENECGGLHILQVCKFGAEAQGLVKGAQPSPLATLSKLAQRVPVWLPPLPLPAWPCPSLPLWATVVVR